MIFDLTKNEISYYQVGKWASANIGMNAKDWHFDHLGRLYIAKDEDAVAFKLKFGL